VVVAVNGTDARPGWILGEANEQRCLAILAQHRAELAQLSAVVAWLSERLDEETIAEDRLERKIHAEVETLRSYGIEVPE
jgi:hypothetical protein